MSDQSDSLRPKDLRLFLPGLVGWASAALGIGLRPGWFAVIGLGLVTCVGLLALRGRAESPLTQFVLASGIATLMMVSVAWGAEYREQSLLRSSENSEVTLTVSLSENYTPGAGSVSVNIREVGGIPIPGPGIAARVVRADLAERTPYGSKVSFRGYLQQSEPWEREGWEFFQTSGALSVDSPGWFLSGADALREGLLDRAKLLGGDGGNLLPGLAIGDTSAVDRGLVQAMQDTSLSHLVAVSGANCAIVVGIVVGLIHLLRGGARAKLVGGTLALAGFVVLVTPEPSIVRASIMASIVLVFLALGKPLKGIPVLALTVLVILAANPWMALDFAFALSVLATGGILLLVGPLSDLLGDVAPRWLAVVLAIPLAAQIACQPVLILLNPVVPLWAVPANALAAPLAPLATILGMLVCVAGPLIPLVADGLAYAAWWPSSAVGFVGRFFASLPVVTLPFPSGIPGALLMAALSYGGLAFLLLRQPAHRLWRRTSGLVLSLALVTVTLGYQVPSWIASASVPSDWIIAQCDVGQGDALLIRSSGRTVLLDTGKYPEKLQRCLRFLGVNHLDVAIITHFDADHVGAWPVIADDVDQVWMGPIVEADHKEIARALESAGARVLQVSAGTQLDLGDHRLRVVWPVAESFVEPGNDSSVVVSLDPMPSCEGCVSALFLGDLGEQPQQILFGRERFTARDVVKVSHHGSRDQFEGLYQVLAAEIGLIGVDSENTYGHPTQGALEILERSGTRAMRSDERGILTLSRAPDGTLKIWSER